MKLKRFIPWLMPFAVGLSFGLTFRGQAERVLRKPDNYSCQEIYQHMLSRAKLIEYMKTDIKSYAEVSNIHLSELPIVDFEPNETSIKSYVMKGYVPENCRHITHGYPDELFAYPLAEEKHLLDDISTMKLNEHQSKRFELCEYAFSVRRSMVESMEQEIYRTRESSFK